MSFFEPPPWRPPSDYRVPAWARGPEDMIPAVLPVALLLARTDTHAVLVDGLLVYPTGFDFDLAIRRRPSHPRQHRDRGHAWGDELRLEVRFADGRRADNDPRRWPPLRRPGARPAVAVPEHQRPRWWPRVAVGVAPARAAHLRV
jgi:hypothetical protein